MDNYAIAKKIARRIFKAGNNPDSPTKRIQFLGGYYPDNETPQGGLCESALISIILAALDE